MLIIDILFEHTNENKDLEILTNKALTTAAQHMKIKNNPEISIVFTNDAFIQTLNNQYRHQDKPTNVLSFPLPGDPFRNQTLGDIIISIETIHREAIEQHKALENHLQHMLIHGFLHLLNYDHIKPKEAEVMENLEVEILQFLGITTPY